MSYYRNKTSPVRNSGISKSPIPHCVSPQNAGGYRVEVRHPVRRIVDKARHIVEETIVDIVDRVARIHAYDIRSGSVAHGLHQLSAVLAVRLLLQNDFELFLGSVEIRRDVLESRFVLLRQRMPEYDLDFLPGETAASSPCGRFLRVASVAAFPSVVTFAPHPGHRHNL